MLYDEPFIWLLIGQRVQRRRNTTDSAAQTTFLRWNTSTTSQRVMVAWCWYATHKTHMLDVSSRHSKQLLAELSFSLSTQILIQMLIDFHKMWCRYILVEAQWLLKLHFFITVHFHQIRFLNNSKYNELCVSIYYSTSRKKPLKLEILTEPTTKTRYCDAVQQSKLCANISVYIWHLQHNYHSGTLKT